jgi:hypothetical protein
MYNDDCYSADHTYHQFKDKDYLYYGTINSNINIFFIFANGTGSGYDTKTNTPISSDNLPSLSKSDVEAYIANYLKYINF